jgi:hypothetical protein
MAVVELTVLPDVFGTPTWDTREVEGDESLWNLAIDTVAELSRREQRPVKAIFRELIETCPDLNMVVPKDNPYAGRSQSDTCR